MHGIAVQPDAGPPPYYANMPEPQSDVATDVVSDAGAFARRVADRVALAYSLALTLGIGSAVAAVFAVRALTKLTALQTALATCLAFLIGLALGRLIIVLPARVRAAAQLGEYCESNGMAPQQLIDAVEPGSRAFLEVAFAGEAEAG